MPTEIDKPLPASPDAERSVLGASLLGKTLEVLAAGVRARHFSVDEHRFIFRHIELVHAHGSEPDLVTVTASLHSAGYLDRAGGAAYIAKLVDGVPKVSNVAHYAAIVRDKATLRRLAHCGDDLKQRALSDEYGDNARELIEYGVSKILSIAENGGGPAAARPWKEVATSALREVEQAMMQPEQAKRIHFGLADLDDMTGGLRQKQLVLIVAPTSHGKTLLIGQGAIQADRDGFKVLFFSAEMPAEQLALREIAYQASVKFYFAQRPEKLNSDEFQRLVAASQRECSVRIVDRDITPARIWAMAEAAKHAHGLDLLIVDYDQLVIEAGMDPNSDDDNVFRHQRAFVFHAKKLAERLAICFVLLSQLRKLSPAVLKGARPHLDDIWGDSSIRNTPHVILWLSRDFFTKGMDKKHERAARVYVLKNRNGRTGQVRLEFDPERLRFLDQQPGEPQQTKPAEQGAERLLYKES